MRKNCLKLACTFGLCLLTGITFAQSTGWNNPDSARNISKPGNPWNITNPIGDNHDTMLHTPFNAAFTDSTDYLYMYDFGLNVPANAMIEGVEMIISRGACNGGSYFLDTVSLAYDSAQVGDHIVDSAGPSSDIDTLGSATDMWNAVLTPAMINSNNFGVMYSSRSVGICTFGVFDCKLKIHYSLPTGVSVVTTSKTITMYPNPASFEIAISTSDAAQGTAYSITDAMGRVVGKGVINSKQTTVNIAGLPAGIYAFRMQDAVTRFTKK